MFTFPCRFAFLVLYAAQGMGMGYGLESFAPLFPLRHRTLAYHAVMAMEVMAAAALARMRPAANRVSAVLKTFYAGEQVGHNRLSRKSRLNISRSSTTVASPKPALCAMT